MKHGQSFVVQIKKVQKLKNNACHISKPLVLATILILIK